MANLNRIINAINSVNRELEHTKLMCNRAFTKFNLNHNIHQLNALELDKRVTQNEKAIKELQRRMHTQFLNIILYFK